MTDKDFAHQPQNTNPERSPEPSASKTSLIVVLAIMFAIACFAAGFSIGEKHGLESKQSNQYENLMKKLEKQQEKIEAFKKEAEKARQQEAETSQLGELTFYTELPKQSITPEPLTTNHQNASRPQTKTNADITLDPQADLAQTEKRLNAIIAQEMRTPTQQYRIQIASFKHVKDANRFVQQLQKAHVSAEVQQVSLANLGIRYRVFTLPFERKEEALNAKEHIKNKFHVTGILVVE